MLKKCVKESFHDFVLTIPLKNKYTKKSMSNKPLGPYSPGLPYSFVSVQCGEFYFNRSQSAFVRPVLP